MTTNLFRILPVALFAAAAAGQGPTFNITTATTTRLAAYDRDFGNNQWGGNIAMDASAERRVTSVWGVPYSATLRIDDSIVGRVRLDGRNREAAAVTTFGQVAGGLGTSGIARSYAAGFTLRVAGNTVLAPTWSGSQTTPLQLVDTTNTLTFLDTTIPISIGPVPVDVRLRAFARSSIGAVLSVNPGALTMQINGDLRAVATGQASVSTNFVVAELGVLATLDLLNTRLTPSIGVSYANGPFGTFDYRVEAARFRIRPYASVWTPWGTQTHYLTVVDENWGLITGSRTLL